MYSNNNNEVGDGQGYARNGMENSCSLLDHLFFVFEVRIKILSLEVEKQK